MNTLEAIHQSKIPEKVAAAGVIAVGTSAMLEVISGTLPLVTMALGGILTILLIYKAVIAIKIGRLELARAHKRRKTDRVVK